VCSIVRGRRSLGRHDVDHRKLHFGLAIVFAVFGLITISVPDVLYGRGTFHERNFGIICSIGVGGLVLGAVFVAFGAAVRRS
jgi:hypothetical protein